MPGFAEVELEEEKRDALPDECQALGEEISRLAGTIDVLENKLSFVLLPQVVCDEEKDAYPEFPHARSDSSTLIREFRIRLAYLIHGLTDIVHRLDL
jgi:hypothetical protein